MSYGDAFNRGLVDTEELKATVQGTCDNFFRLARAMNETTENADKTEQSVKEVATATNQLSNIKISNDGFVAFVNYMRQTKQELEAATERARQFEQMLQAVTEIAFRMDTGRTFTTDLGKQLPAVIDDMKSLGQEMQSINQIEDAMGSGKDLFAIEAIQGEDGVFRNIEDSLTEATSTASEFSDAISDIGESISNLKFDDPTKYFGEGILDSIDKVRSGILDLENKIREFEQSYAQIQEAFESGNLEGYSQSYKSVLFREKEIMSQLIPMLKERKSL